MRVLQMAIGFEGGIGKLLVDYCTILKKDVEFEFLIGSYENGLFESILREHSFVIHHLPVNYTRKDKIKIVKAIIREKSFDAIHIHGVCDFDVLRLAKKEGIRNRIVHSHNAVATLHYDSFLYRVLRNLYRNIMYRLFVTEKWACGIEAGKSMWGEKAVNSGSVRIITNAIETECYRFNQDMRAIKRSILGIDSDCKVLGTVGRLTKQKNHAFMIDVFKQFVMSEPNARLVLIGEGELKTELENKALELGISNKVIFLGNRSDVCDLLNIFDLFVLTSFFEGLPVVMIEAQANGLPCLVSNEITKEADLLPNNQYLSLSDSAKAWSNKAITLINAGRDDCAMKILTERGYDIKSAAMHLKDIYLSMEVRQ